MSLSFEDPTKFIEICISYFVSMNRNDLAIAYVLLMQLHFVYVDVYTSNIAM